MSTIATAERVSLEKSDNYVFQRSVLAYHRAAELVEGDILEIGTGSGYGVEVIAPKATRYISIDKELPEQINQLGNVEYYDMASYGNRCPQMGCIHIRDRSSRLPRHPFLLHRPRRTP